MAKILIIDDDPLVAESLSHVVEKLGHRALLAGSVAEAHKAVRAQDIDLVFCDVRMPDGSGLDLLPDLRVTPSAPEVIIMTGFGDPDG
ncbi:MAG TPA: response regulator, partial [Acidobacteriota bacterium]|nr:response regulator [Acidobacteriota bacterium]